MKRMLLSAALILCGALSVAAQDGPPPGQGGPPPGGAGGQGGPGGQRFQIPTFEELDKNKDKKIARDEFTGPQQFFERIDEDKDGLISEEEWQRVRARMGQGGAQRLAEAFTKFMDGNKDGKITRDEFARLVEIFEALDRDKSGELTQEELGRFFQAMNEVAAKATGGVEVANLFEKFDKNKDNKIVAEEMANERTFKALDNNKDGVITREEAEYALRVLAERSRQRQAQ